MDRQLEKRLSNRAVAIGREGEVAGFDELLKLLTSSSANARRLAASAMGKLAWMGVDQPKAVSALAAMVRCDPHPLWVSRKRLSLHPPDPVFQNRLPKCAMRENQLSAVEAQSLAMYSPLT